MEIRLNNAYLKRKPMTKTLRDLGVNRENFAKCLVELSGISRIDMKKVELVLLEQVNK